MIRGWTALFACNLLIILGYPCNRILHRGLRDPMPVNNQTIHVFRVAVSHYSFFGYHSDSLKPRSYVVNVGFEKWPKRIMNSHLKPRSYVGNARGNITNLKPRSYVAKRGLRKVTPKE